MLDFPLTKLQTALTRSNAQQHKSMLCDRKLPLIFPVLHQQMIYSCSTPQLHALALMPGTVQLDQPILASPFCPFPRASHTRLSAPSELPACCSWGSLTSSQSGIFDTREWVSIMTRWRPLQFNPSLCLARVKSSNLLQIPVLL